MKIALIAALASTLAAAAYASEDLAFATFAQQQQAMTSGKASAESLTKLYLTRIDAMNHKGPRLNAVIALNSQALADARRLDAERKAGRVRGPLHGVPILLKDNIDSNDGTATTGGSLALKDNVTNRDAPLVKRLRDAGAVILGKTNMSEWANYRSSRSISGWSAVGGLVRNPYALDRGACGSSSGSGVAVAAALASGAIGTETDGSITCPAAMNGLVGLKPTVGLISRTHIIPISATQDTAGPMTRTVTDTAALLTVLAGTDATDAATAEADEHKTDYLKALDVAVLKGARIGVIRGTTTGSPAIDIAYEAALVALKGSGAILVEIPTPNTERMEAAEDVILATEFKEGINAYLATTAPGRTPSRTLADLIAFNDANAGREMALFGQETFKKSLAAPGLTDPAYLKAREEGPRLAGRQGIDTWLAASDVEFIVAVASGPAPRVDPINGVRWLGSFSSAPAIAGYPHLVVPMGNVAGLPLGISFIGAAWSEARLLAVGYAFEQATHAARPPAFPASVDLQSEISASYDPHF